MVIIKRHLDVWYICEQFSNFDQYANIIEIEGFSFHMQHDFDIIFIQMYK